MIDMKTEYDRQLVIIKQNNAQRFDCQLTIGLINFHENTQFQFIDQFPGGLNHYNTVLLSQYKAEQIAIKNYAKTLGIIAPEDNLNSLCHIMTVKHNVSQDITRKAYQIIMGIDE